MVCVHSKIDKIQLLADDLLPQLATDHMKQKGNVLYIQAQKKISS